MRKYWYYTYKTRNSIGSGICYSNDGEFDIAGKIEYLESKHPDNKDNLIVIDNWKEISKEQYEKMNQYFDNKNK